ncbi:MULTISPECIES: hypothetical protein [unclassified Acidovorax]|nr:hypothetical protein [Acidovorax sp. sif0632]MBV7466992.1 hypothetical protein [Acidovorax sp. sif0613]
MHLHIDTMRHCPPPGSPRPRHASQKDNISPEISSFFSPFRAMDKRF